MSLLTRYMHTKQLLISNLSVRLVGDRKRFSYGRVEVFSNGTWGTLCTSRWNLNDGHVICRQLGFDGAVSAPWFGAFGQGAGMKWMNDLNCAGNESSLSECRHGQWILVHSCGYHPTYAASAMCKLKGDFYHI